MIDWPSEMLAEIIQLTLAAWSLENSYFTSLRNGFISILTAYFIVSAAMTTVTALLLLSNDI